MRILMLAPHVPWPLNQGTAIRNYHIAMQLAARHHVSMITYASTSGHTGPLEQAGVRVITVPQPGPRGIGRRFVDLFTTTTPDLARRLDSPEMTAIVAEVIEQPRQQHDPGGFDVILVEGLEMSRHALQAHQLSGARLVYDAHNAEWVLQHRAWQTDRAKPRQWHGALYSRAQAWKLRRFERRLLGVADATVAVSQRDAEALTEVAPGAVIRVVPNGVDTSFYSVADRGVVDANSCVFVGKMDFRPNVDAMVWFCTAVWPSIVKRCPAARFMILGRDPTPRVRALSSPSVTVTGAVDDVRPYLDAAGVVVVPLRVGGGTRLKVLEAMACGKAIAATSLAVEGLTVEHDRDALLADSADTLADAVVRMLGDEMLRDRLGVGARATVETRYDWTALVPSIEHLLAGDESDV